MRDWLKLLTAIKCENTPSDFIGLTSSVRIRPNHHEDRTIEGNIGKRKLDFLLTGIAAGFAHLTRADGLLFLFIGIAFWILYAAKGRKGPGKSSKDLNQHGEEVNTLQQFLVV